MADDPLKLGDLNKQAEDARKKQDEALTRQYMRFFQLLTEQNNGYMTAPEAEELARLNEQLTRYETDNPEAAKALSSSAWKSFQGTNADGTSEQEPLPGDGSGSIASIFNSTRNRDSATTRAISSTSRRTQTEFIDLPTPEEFLDDFDNAYNMHVTGLVQSGALRPEVAAFARDNIGLVFGEYLREQTARLLNGEPLWKVVGLNADNKLIGSREGFGLEDKNNTQIGEQTRSRESESTSGSSTTTPSATGAGQAIDSESSSGTTNTTDNSVINEDKNEILNTTEAIISRNKLGYVHSLAPLDFLKDKASSQRLNLLFGGQKGTAARQAQTATGGESTAARRV